MADYCEISSFVSKFNQLKYAGDKASLHIDCEHGHSFVTLQVHLLPSPHPPYPHRPDYEDPLRRHPHQPHGRHQDGRQERHYLPHREQPARPRRREERASAQGKGARIAGEAITSPPHLNIAAPLLPNLPPGLIPQNLGGETQLSRHGEVD